jgi:hypothetical protein
MEFKFLTQERRTILQRLAVLCNNENRNLSNYSFVGRIAMYNLPI